MEFSEHIDIDCAFNINSKSGVCSDKKVINKLHKFTVNFDKNVKTPSDVINSLKKKYNCNSESCIFVQGEISDVLNSSEIQHHLKYRFKPKGPRNTTEWLSNIDIDDVLAQIEQKYSDRKFLHIKFQMIDFEQTGSELGILDFAKKYKEGYRTFGTVVNTDYSTGNGIHWFAIFGDFSDNKDKFTIEYFNSSGEPPMDEIIVWFKKVKHQWGENFNKPIEDIIVSKIQHQKDNHSCGPYSLYYIISRLDGISYENFRNNRIPDSVMHKFRKYLFRDEE